MLLYQRDGRQLVWALGSILVLATLVKWVALSVIVMTSLEMLSAQRQESKVNVKNMDASYLLEKTHMSTCRRAELKYFSSLFLAIEDELEHDSIFGTNDIEKREENLKEKRLETTLQKRRENIRKQ